MAKITDISISFKLPAFLTRLPGMSNEELDQYFDRATWCIWLIILVLSLAECYIRMESSQLPRQRLKRRGRKQQKAGAEPDTKAAAVEAETTAASEKISESQNACTKVGKDLTATEKESKALNESLKSTGAGQDAKNAEITSLTDLNRKKEAELAEEKSKAAEQQSRIQCLQKQLEEARAAAKVTQKEAMALESTTGEHMEAKKATHMETDAENAARETREAELSGNQADLERANKSLSSQEAEISSLKEQIQQLEEEKEAAAAEAVVDKEQLEEALMWSVESGDVLRAQVKELQAKQNIQTKFDSDPKPRPVVRLPKPTATQMRSSIATIDAKTETATPVVTFPQSNLAGTLPSMEDADSESDPAEPPKGEQKSKAEIDALLAEKGKAKGGKIQDINNQICYYNYHDQLTGKTFPCKMRVYNMCVGKPQEYFTNGQYYFPDRTTGEYFFGGMVDHWKYDAESTNAKSNDKTRRDLAKKLEVCRWWFNRYEPNPRQLPPSERPRPGSIMSSRLAQLEQEARNKR